MGVTGLDRPEFRTIADFRKRHLVALSDLFVQVLRLCRAAGLVEFTHVAVDGTQFKANASRLTPQSDELRADEDGRADPCRRGVDQIRWEVPHHTAWATTNGDFGRVTVMCARETAEQMRPRYRVMAFALKVTSKDVHCAPLIR